MSMLHTINKSPFERGSLETCLRLAKPGAAVLLIEDGVYAALADTAKSSLVEGHKDDLKFYVLGVDLDARGLSEQPMIEGVETVDYGGFVDLVTAHDAVHSWL
jgi:tRNA 2-thiouridine synthesizing protein B